MPSFENSSARRLLSPRELADAIGVSESSLKRWVDDGLLRAARTAGRHRRIAISEAIRFIRATGSAVVRPELLGLNDLAALDHAPRHDLPFEEQLFSALLEGRATTARGLLLNAYLGGMSVAEIADGPLRTALARIGELWQHQSDGIFIEHRAIDICIQAVNQLRLLLEVADHAPQAVGGAPEGDPYLLPSILAACALIENGFDAINLGANTPADSLIQAARHHHAKVCWLSVSSTECVQPAAKFQQLADETHAMGAALIIGGRFANALQLPVGPNVHIGQSMKQLAEVARHAVGMPNSNDAGFAEPAGNSRSVFR